MRVEERKTLEEGNLRGTEIVECGLWKFDLMGLLVVLEVLTNKTRINFCRLDIDNIPFS